MQRPFDVGDQLELTPTRTGRRGEAETDHQGWRVRIPGGIPGEAARVTLVHVSKGGPMAVAQWDGPAGEPHPARREPPCPIHDTCGGCGTQHLAEDASLRFKIAQAQEQLGVPLAAPIESPHLFGYRAKAFVLPQIRASRLLLGARPPRGNRLVDTTGCGVLRPELEALAARARAILSRRTDESHHLRALLMRCNREGKTQLTAVHRGSAGWLTEAAVAIGADAAFTQRHDAGGNRIHSDEEEEQVTGKEPLVERFGGIEVAIPPTAFMQGNPDVAEQLYARAAEALTGTSIVELYCGSGAAGLLALRLHPDATLVGVDRAPRAITAAESNARRNGLAGRCRFVTGDAADAVLDGDVVLVNPPRAGCAEEVVDAIAASPARRLVYLSCSPATLARDIERLGWDVESCTPADMFPQTPHLEILAVLKRP